MNDKITIDRATVQQALDALEYQQTKVRRDEAGWFADEYDSTITAIRAALAAPEPGKTCPACGSDCNERDELFKAEREIERLTKFLHPAWHHSAQPVQEPVGEVVDVIEGAFKVAFSRQLSVGTKLYTAPQPQQTALSAPDSTSVVALERVPFRRFLSDVHTVAGLVSHGKQCKALGERLGERVLQYLAVNPQPQRQPLTDERIMEIVFTECDNMRWPSTALFIARAIEQEHGIVKGPAA